MFSEEIYHEFYYLFRRFVEQSQINIIDKEKRSPTLSEKSFEKNNFRRNRDFDVLDIAGVEFYIHLFNNGHYGKKYGNGSGKVPYMDYHMSNDNWVNIRTTFEDYKMISVRFAIWDDSSKKEIETGKIYHVAPMELSFEERPNAYFKGFIDDYMSFKKGVNQVSENRQVKEISNKLKNAKNIILRGAPGTGKSYMAKEIAAELIGIDKNQLDFSEQFEFVQFHPSYDYTDFVEGLRPVISDEDGTMGFELKPGIFKSFCEKAIIRQTRDGVDNFESCFEEYLDYINTKEDKEYITKSCFITVNSKNNLKVTFDSGVEGGVIPRAYLYELYKDSHYDKQRYYQTNGKTVLKKLTNEFGLKPYKKPKFKSHDSSQPFVFVIDEINRGEISKIFGELFFSIDPEYRGPSGSVKTQYASMNSNSESFYIPSNVYIIGTMNDIDRSVDTFDFAMRRRFMFLEITAEESAENMGLSSSVKEQMARLNRSIVEKGGLTSDYQIGASYFKALEVPEEDDKNAPLWEHKLYPLLKDYFRGEYKSEDILEKIKKDYFNKED